MRDSSGKALGRNVKSAHHAEFTPFFDFGMPDGARVVLVWSDGAKRYEWFDDADEAMQWLARIGFEHN